MKRYGAHFIMMLSFLFSWSVLWADETMLAPQIDGEWWTVAGNPDLGEYSTPKQQPVDFAVWQAVDETWQLWSCIRHTSCGGKTRLFYRWQGEKLTDPDWMPMGVAMEADPNFDETSGGLQAPHVIRIGVLYHMFYGDWEHICQAFSMDGKTFARRLMRNGKSGMFTEGIGDNTRDAMVLKIDNQYYCYYTAYPKRKGSVYCRTSYDLEDWSDSHQIAHGGQAGDNPYSAECPHVVKRHDYYYLFRTQRYGQNAQTFIYRSKNPLDFGVNDDRYFIGRLPIAAPEIIEYQGKDYIAVLKPELDGIQIARLQWVEK